MRLEDFRYVIPPEIGADPAAKAAFIDAMNADAKHYLELVKALEEKLDAKLYICDEAQLCGALGAALFAYEKCSV